MTVVLSYAENVTVVSPRGNLSRKVINSDQFFYVNLVYLYPRVPGDSWSGSDPAS